MLIPLASALCGATSAADNASQTAIRLAHRFSPGMELVYNFTSALHQKNTAAGEKHTYDMTLAGTIRHTAVESDPAAGTTLFGLAGTGTWTMASGPGGVSGTTRDQTWIASYRLERDGRIVPRDTRKEDRVQNLVHRSMNQVSENAQLFPAFPTNHLAVGSRWEGSVLLPLPGIRQTGRARATVVELRTVESANCCVIRCDIGSEKGQSFATYQSSLNRPDIAIKGTTEGVFDIGRGIWLSTEVDLTATITGPSFDGSMAVKGRSTLAAASTLEAAALRDRAARFLAFEGAIATMYRDEVEAAEESLRNQQSAAADLEWKAGLATTLGLLDVARKEIAADRQGPAADEGPEHKLLAEADKAAREEKWKEAVQKYEKIAKDHPATEAAIQALSAAADIYEQKLSKKSNAESLRRRIVALREESARRRKDSADAALSLYKQASSLENAGDLKKAASTYESFLAAGAHGVPVQTRVIARYRLGGVYDRLGNRQKAAEAYRAVAASDADDDYGRKLKDKAREKLTEYGAQH